VRDHTQCVLQLDVHNLSIISKGRLCSSSGTLDSKVVPTMRDPGLLHITALLSRMDDRMENIENNIVSLMSKLDAWIGSDEDGTEYTLDWGSGSEMEVDEEEEQEQEATIEPTITINGIEYEIELINIPMQ
jgi:hypothetical protein